jgi:large subunit ribosomal protein L4
MSAQVLTIDAAKAAKIDLITNGKGTQAVHDVVVALRANRRTGTACVKTKATVDLSGAKPWRQKGTGRARAGYKSSPVWVGGGVVFGPHPRDYSKRVSKNVKRLALRKALSERIKDGDVLVTDSFAVAAPKTKDFLKLLQGCTPEAKVLIVADKFDDTTKLAARNVRAPRLITAAEVNTEDLLRFKKIIVTNSALSQIAERLSK